MSDKIPSVFFRGLLCWLSLATVMLSIFTPTSLTRVLVVKAGTVGTVAAVVFALAVLWMTLDLIVSRGKVPVFSAYRGMPALAVAGVYWLFAALALMSGNPLGSWVLITYYLGVGCFGIWYAAYVTYKQYTHAVQN